VTLRHRDEGGAVRTAGAIFLRDTDGTDPGDLVTVDQIKLRVVDGTDPGDLKQAYQQGIRLSVVPESASGFSGSKGGSIATNYVTVSAAGGTPPYDHVWSTDAGISASSPLSASTYFTGTPETPSGDIVGNATDTVTDAIGVVNTIVVPVSITRGAI
jgi:hypothetical protein